MVAKDREGRILLARSTQSRACFGAGRGRVRGSIWSKRSPKPSACWDYIAPSWCHGLDGLDEITITGPTRVAEARDGLVRSYEVNPEEFGIRRATLEDISGGDAADNAAIVREVFEWKEISASRCGCVELRGRDGSGGTCRSC